MEDLQFDPISISTSGEGTTNNSSTPDSSVTSPSLMEMPTTDSSVTSPSLMEMPTTDLSVTSPSLIEMTTNETSPSLTTLETNSTNPSLITTQTTGPAPISPLLPPEDLIGGPGPDLLEGDAQSRRLLGRQGNDSLFGGSGLEYLDGDQGDDIVRGNGGTDLAVGGQGDDLVEGGDDNDVIYGEQGNDTLNGDNGDDFVHGGQGSDLISGGAGIDVIYGGKGKDTIIAGSNNDTISADRGDDEAEGGEGDDSLSAGEGNDTISGDGGTDTVSGDAGDDEVEGGEGDDSLSGGTGNDTCLGDAGEDSLTGDAGEDLLSGGAGNDSLDAGAGNDTLSGGTDNDTCTAGEGDDEVSGGEGNDSLNAGTGNDSVSGGDGEDSINGEDGDDTISAGSGNDSVDAGAGDDDISCEEGNDTVEAGSGNDSVTAGAGDDSISCADGDDSVNAGSGNDSVDAGDGADVIDTEDGNDSIEAGTGNDTVNAGSGDDSISCSEGDDSISAESGNDTVEGGAGNDTVSAGSGDDSISCAEGDDSISAEDGNDTVSGGTGNDTVTAGAGNDTITGDEGNDSLTAGSGNDSVDGGVGDDSVVGGSGDSTLAGGEGNDTIAGGTGNHTCVGGAGEDVFLIENMSTPSNSVIFDYNTNTDKFLLGKGLKFTDLSFVDAGKNTQLKINNVLVSVINNITVNQINVNNFFQLGDNGTMNPVGTTPAPVTSGTPAPAPATAPTTVPTPAAINPPPAFSSPFLNSNSGQTLPAGIQRIISSDELNYTNDNVDPSKMVYTITKLPTNGKLLLNGQPLTGENPTFTQADVNQRRLSFVADKDVKGAVIADFEFQVYNGFTFIINQKFEIDIFQTSFNFAGATVPQVITASPVNDTVEGGDSDDDIKGEGGKDKVKGGKGKDKVDGGDDDDDIEGGDDEDELKGGPGKDRFIYKKERQGGDDGDDLADFDPEEDRLHLDSNIFGKLNNGKFKSAIVSEATTDVGDASLLILDIEFESKEKVKEKLQKLGIANRPVLCVFRNPGGVVRLVFVLEDRIEVIAKFKTDIKLSIKNFIFTNGEENVTEGSGSGSTLEGSLTEPNRFVFNKPSVAPEQGDTIVNFNPEKDTLQLDAASFGNLNKANFSSLSVNSQTTSVGNANFLIFDGKFKNVQALLERASSLQIGNRPVFCMFENEEGQSVLVFSIGSRVEIVAKFVTKIILNIANFIFAGEEAMPPLQATEGNDILDGSKYTSQLTIDLLAGDDSILGSGLDDSLVGNVGNDSIFGGNGSDSLFGGSGADLLNGGSGTDLFGYQAPTEGNDQIADFKPGQDKLLFSSSGFGKFSKDNFDSITISGTTTNVTDKELLIFTSKGNTLESIEKQYSTLSGLGTTPVFTLFENAAGEAVLAFDGDGSGPMPLMSIANLGSSVSVSGTSAGSLSSADFVFTGTVAQPVEPTKSTIVDLLSTNNTYPSSLNNFGTGTGGYGFTAPVLFSGNNEPNNVTATDFADILNGKDGDDTMFGMSGPDSMNGGAGNDNLSGGPGDDSLYGEAGADILWGGSGADLLSGGVGADLFIYKEVSQGNDTIAGFESGSDKLEFLASSFGNMTTANFDAVTGPAPDITGKELVIFGAGTFASFTDAQNTVTGTGTTASFYVYSNANNERVLVFDGNGTLADGFAPIANFGTGVTNLGTADFLFTGSAPPVVPPTTSNSSIVDLLSTDNTYPSAVNNFGSEGYGFTIPVLFIGDNNGNHVTGTDFADILNGNDGADTLLGMSGPDRISGGPGADVLWGGSGPDVLIGGIGADLFIYKNISQGNDTIEGFESGIDKLEFLASSFGNMTTANFDAVTGTAPDITGKELVIFGEGTFASFADAQSTVTGTGTTPAFYVYSNANNERVLVFDGNGTLADGFAPIANLGAAAIGTADFLFTGSIPTLAPVTFSSTVSLLSSGNTYPAALNDFGTGPAGYAFTSPVLFEGNGDNNSVIGTTFPDFLYGEGGNDTLNGGFGGDLLSGGSGTDLLYGGSGSDLITGGLGIDTFAYGNFMQGGDTITDFANDDILRFTSTSFADISSVTFKSVNSTSTDVTGGNVIDLTGMTSVSSLALAVEQYGTQPGAAGPAFLLYNSNGATMLAFDSNGPIAGGGYDLANLGSLKPTANQFTFL